MLTALLESSRKADFTEAKPSGTQPHLRRLEAMKPTILLLISDSELIQSLTRLFESKFKVQAIDPHQSDSLQFQGFSADLIIAAVEAIQKGLALKLQEAGKGSPPILALGSREDLNSANHLVNNGVTDILDLPLKPELTLHRVTNYLQAHVARRKLADSLKKPSSSLNELCEEAVCRSLELEKASRLKDDFIAMLSHELRNPINVISGYAEVLLEGLEDRELSLEAARAIYRNAQFQSQLILDLMDVSKSMNGKMVLNCRPVALADLTHEILPSARNSALKKKIQLNFQKSCAGLIDGDPTRISQVIWNLVANAIKFTPEQGRIDISLEKQGSWVVLSVRDTGVGIDPAFLPHIFEQFHQQDVSITRKYGGLGLGLTIVKNIVELHHGKVSAFSSGNGHGSTFTVYFPSLPA